MLDPRQEPVDGRRRTLPRVQGITTTAPGHTTPGPIPAKPARSVTRKVTPGAR